MIQTSNYNLKAAASSKKKTAAPAAPAAPAEPTPSDQELMRKDAEQAAEIAARMQVDRDFFTLERDLCMYANLKNAFLSETDRSVVEVENRINNDFTVVFNDLKTARMSPLEMKEAYSRATRDERMYADLKNPPKPRSGRIPQPPQRGPGAVLDLTV
ncbi:MAG: hypothetical protein U0931_17590 [Vulcanimicrobiota bacterium]